MWFHEYLFKTSSILNGFVSTLLSALQVERNSWRKAVWEQMCTKYLYLHLEKIEIHKEEHFCAFKDAVLICDQIVIWANKCSHIMAGIDF